MIKKIVIEIDGTEHAVDFEQARKLYADLHQVFGSPVIYPPVSVPYSVPEPQWPPVVWYTASTQGASDDTLYVRQ